jgi:hypothetical protein
VDGGREISYSIISTATPTLFPRTVMYAQSLTLKAGAPSLLLPTSTLNTPLSSAPPSPGPSLLLPAVNFETHAAQPRKVLYMPTVRAPRLPPAASYTARAARVKGHANSRLSRSRHMSIPTISLEPETNPWNASHWFNSPCKFEVVREQMEISGYQLYAVEKWYDL